MMYDIVAGTSKMSRVHKSAIMVLFITLCIPATSSVQASRSTFPQVNLILWHQQGEAVIQQLGIQRIFDSWASVNAPGSTLTLVQKDNLDMVNHFNVLPPTMVAPDLLWTSADEVIPYVRKGLIQPVDSVVDMKRFLPILLENVSVNGKSYGVPLQAGNFLMLFYNKKYVKQAPQTFDELQTIAVDLAKNNTGDPHFLAFAYDEWDPYWAFPIANGFGAAPLSQDGKTPTLDTDAWIKTFQFVHDLKFKGQILPETCDYECADSSFRAGETAITINGDWALQGDHSYTDVLGADLGIAPLPALGAASTQQRPIPSVVGQYVLIPSTTTGDKLTTAEAFLNFLATDKATVLSWTVPNRRLPALLDALNSDAIANDPILVQTSKILMTGISYPVRPEMKCITTVFALPFLYMMNDSTQPADLVKQVQQKALDCIAHLPQ
jgi:maltose-binding protein MalE